MITWVPSVIDTCDLQTIDFDYLAQAISGSTYKKKCEKIRAITDRKQRNILKADTLPAFSMCTFDGLGRDEDHVLTVNGLTLDYDECNGNADQIRKAMQAAGARIIFDSPSGDGVKASFEYSRSISKQEHDRIKYDITHGMQLKAGHKLCSCSSNAVQLSFVSYDPDVILQTGKPIDVDALLTHAKKDPHAEQSNPCVVVSLPVSNEIKKKIIGGAPEGERSEAAFSVLCSLLHAKVPVDTIFKIFDAELIGEKYREKRSGKHKWLLEEISRARTYLNQETKAPPQQGLIISSVADWLHIAPPKQEFIFDGVLIKGITGFFHGVGGVGKSSVNNSVVLSLTTGADLWEMFKPARAFRVMFLCAEDNPDIVRRRMYALGYNLSQDEREQVQKAIDKNLILIAGQPLPLLELKDGNPVKAEGFEVLMALIKEQCPDVLMLDPKSMFSGCLDENNNAHATAFISLLKDFNKIGITVLFTHHESKALAGQGSQFGSRGGQALSDGVRWQVSLSRMTPQDGDSYGVDAGNFVKVEQTKSNYTRFFAPFYLERGEGGVLERVDLTETKRVRIINAVKEVLASGITCQPRDIDKKDGKDFRAMVKDLSGATIKDLKPIISGGLLLGIFVKDDEGFLCAA